MIRLVLLFFFAALIHPVVAGGVVPFAFMPLPMSCTAGSQLFTASGTFTTPKGNCAFRVLVVGGGGAGSGNVGSGGGSGYVQAGHYSSLPATVSVTVGAGGAAATNADGLDGAPSSFGTLLTAAGGSHASGYGGGCRSNADGGNGGSGGGGTNGSGGANGTSGGGATGPCVGGAGGTGAGAFPLSGFKNAPVQVGAAGASGTSGAWGVGGGGGGGVIINSLGGYGGSGSYADGGSGGQGFGAGGGGEADLSYPQAQGKGNSGAVYIEWSGPPTNDITIAISAGAARWSDGTYATGCKGYRNPSAGYSYSGQIGDGIYWIDPDGPGGAAAFKAYCDMTDDGGGWTMIVAQYETSPVTNWNAGIQGDYDPTLATKKGFALNTAQIPPHTQTAFGKDTYATFIDYVTFTYSTGNIAKTLLGGLKSGAKYHIHRDSAQYYDFHDPEGSSVTTDPNWYNTLTFDAMGGPGYTWAFCPLNTGANRGYAMAGTQLSGSSETYAWTVWVR